MRKGKLQNDMNIGAIIGRIVAHWKSGETEEALEVAIYESQQFRDHPDIACITGRAYLRAEQTQQHLEKADALFRHAYDKNCKRPELFELWMETKNAIGDWTGLKDVAELAKKRTQPADGVYYYALAHKELGEGARIRGDLLSAASYYNQGARSIKIAFDKNHAVGRVRELMELKSDLAHAYVQTTNTLYSREGDYLQVWLACFDAFEMQVISPLIIRLGTTRLVNWWRTVEMRDSMDHKAARLLDVQLDKLRDMSMSRGVQERWEGEIANEINSIQVELEQRRSAYLNA